MPPLTKDERNGRMVHQFAAAAVREFRLYAMPRGTPLVVQRQLLALERMHREASKGCVELLSEQRCPSCGCTDSNACDGGCYWVQTRSGLLCSNCAPATKRSTKKRGRTR